MKIYPQDLGASLYEKILRMRVTHLISDVDIASLAELRRSWICLPRPKEDRARYEKAVSDLLLKGKKKFNWIYLLPYSGLITIPLVPYLTLGHVPWELWGLFLMGTIPAIFTCAGVANAKLNALRRLLPELQGAVTSDEIIKLQKRADSLTQSYLMLLWTVANMPNIDATAQEHVSTALQSIGNTIERLPSEYVTAPNEPGPGYLETLKTEAGHLKERARLEQDPQIAASLMRQAEALTSYVGATNRLATVHRRNGILREEIAMHIRSMRATCEGYRLGGVANSSDFVTLAANIQQVAAEAGYNAAARDELDEALGPVQPSFGTTPEVAEKTLRIRI